MLHEAITIMVFVDNLHELNAKQQVISLICILDINSLVQYVFHFYNFVYTRTRQVQIK